jgi:predicted AlkP superfamily phosphohydrolase/phosphomutase
VQGRDEQGIVPVAQYQSLCEDLSARLLEWRDPINGDRVVRRVWQRNAVYDGPCVSMAPDLVLDLATPGGYSYIGLPSLGAAGAPIEALDLAALGAGKLVGMSGSHRSDGLFMLCGDGVRRGRVAGAQIADMASAILRLCGLASPADWDGRPLSCLPPIALEAVETGSEQSTVERPYGAVAAADLERRLTDLGYLA